MIYKYHGADLFAVENDLEGEAEVRALRLTWDVEDGDKAQWTFPCGCTLHPTDDNGTHGGGPHIHACEQHESNRDKANERTAVEFQRLRPWQ